MPESSFRNSPPTFLAAPDVILSARQFLVFSTGRFPGNPATIHEIAAFPADSALLEHSRSLASIDNAYYLQAAEPGRYLAKCFSHTAPLTVCGHALLATGHHLLAATGLHELTLDTPAFTHRCKRVGAAGTLLSLPRYAPQPLTDSVLVDKLLAATRLTHAEVEIALVFPFSVYVLITTSLAVLQDFQPAGFAWEELSDHKPGALLLSCALADGAYAFRYFSPWWGKEEDSATGSAHSYLAPYWLREGQRAETLQCSPAGPASAQVQLAPDVVWISGQVSAAD